MEAAYITPIYAALIIYVGVVAPRKLAFIIASFCVICFSLIVLFEYLGILPSFAAFNRTPPICQPNHSAFCNYCDTFCCGIHLLLHR